MLPAAAFKPNPRSESTENIAGVLSSHSENFETIQNKITVLERELKSNICAVQESVQGHFSDDSSVCVHSQVEKDRSREHTDRSHNVVVFGVPESRDLLGTEELVSRAFESVVGRKVTIVDFKPGRNCTSIKLEVPESYIYRWHYFHPNLKLHQNCSVCRRPSAISPDFSGGGFYHSSEGHHGN